VYASAEGIEKATNPDIDIMPIPKDRWDVRYNWRTDELEAVADPIFTSSSKKMTDFYIVIINEKGDLLYPKGEELDFNEKIPLYDGKVNKYIGKYMKSWVLPDNGNSNANKLELQRGGTYRCAVKVAGYETQFDWSLLKPVVIDSPSIKKWNVAFDPNKQIIKAWVETKGIPGTYSVQLWREGKDSPTILPIITNSEYSSVAQYYKEINMNDLDLSFGNSYNFYIRAVDQADNEVDKTGLLNKSVIKPVLPPTILPNDINKLYLDYAAKNQSFDMTSNGQYSFNELNLCIENISDPYAFEWKFYNNFFDIQTWLKKENHLDTEKWEKSIIYKEEILKMIKDVQDNKVNQVIQKYDEIKKSYDRYSSLADVPIPEKDLKNIQEILEKNYKNASNILNKAKKIYGYGKITAKTLDYITIVIATYEVNDEVLAAFKRIADIQKGTAFSQAVNEIALQYEKGKENIKIMEIVDKIKSDLSSSIVDGIVSKAGVLGAAKTIIDITLDISGINNRMESINSAIADGFIQYYGSLAYNKYRKAMDAEGIKDSGIVYLLGSKYANQNYLDFLTELSKKKYASEISDVNIRITSTDNGIEQWINKGILTSIGTGGGGGGSNGGF